MDCSVSSPPVQRHQPDRHAALRRYNSLDTPTEAPFDDIVRLVASLLNAPVAALILIDERRQWFKAKVGGLIELTARAEDGQVVVAVAYDGYEALRLTRERCPDVAIMDIGMSGLTGYEVARMVRKAAQLERTVLVALTGWDAADDRAPG